MGLPAQFFLQLRQGQVVDTQGVASDVPPEVPWFAVNHFSDSVRMAIAVSSSLAVNRQALSICSSHPCPSSLSMPAPHVSAFWPQKITSSLIFVVSQMPWHPCGSAVAFAFGMRWDG